MNRPGLAVVTLVFAACGTHDSATATAPSDEQALQAIAKLKQSHQYSPPAVSQTGGANAKYAVSCGGEYANGGCNITDDPPPTCDYHYSCPVARSCTNDQGQACTITWNENYTVPGYERPAGQFPAWCEGVYYDETYFAGNTNIVDGC